MTVFSDQIDHLAETLKRRYTNVDDAPPILYHYTDARGLLGLIESKSVWATNAKFLNDPTELDWIREVVAAAARSVPWTNPHAKLLAEELAGIEGVFMGSAYVTSFSANRDLLSQWRAYGGDGLGYAVGVATSAALEPVLDWPDAPPPSQMYGPASSLSRVSYEPKAQGGLLWDVVVAMLAALNTLDEATAAVEQRVVYGAIVEIMQRFYPVIKNPGFEEEVEWRVVFWNHAAGGYLEPLKFRPSSQGIAPYVSLRWQTEDHQPPIQEIVMGPRIPESEGLSALFMMLLTHGYSAGSGEVKPALSHSAATYRK